MSTRLQSRRGAAFRRPAPPGVHRFVRRVDRPPHGWEPLHPTVGEKVRIHADRAVLSLADAAAHRISRRRFLSGAGKTGLAIGMGLSWMVRTATPASARCYQCGDPCGPSPPCGSAKCLSSGDCNTNVAGVRYRQHDGTACTSSAGQCWLADCCGCATGAGKRTCCDCCIDADPNNCTSPCSPKKKCICSKALGCP